MLFSKAIEGFILDANAGRYSPAYVPTLRGYLKGMCKFFEDPELDALTADDWKRYFTHLHTEYKPVRWNGNQSPLSPASIDNHWKTMRGFYNWAVEILDFPNRPDLKIKREKFQSPQITPFTREEIIKIIDACQHTQVVKKTGRTYKIKRQNAERDKAIIMLLLDTGMRLGELARLRLGDVDLETGEVHIRPYRDGRKSKSRILFMGTRTRQIVWRYIAKQQAATNDQTLPLIELQPASIKTLWGVLATTQRF